MWPYVIGPTIWIALAVYALWEVWSAEVDNSEGD